MEEKRTNNVEGCLAPEVAWRQILHSRAKKDCKNSQIFMFRVQEFYNSGTDAAAGAAAGAAATAAASAAAFVFTTVFTVVATVAAAEAAAVAAAVAAAPAAASVSEEKNSWTLNIIRFLVFVTLFLHGGVIDGYRIDTVRHCFRGRRLLPA